MRPAAAFLPLALVVACGGSGENGSHGAVDSPPSVLLVSIDTLRQDHMGVYGYERDTTPYLDKLAEECLVFDRAYTSAPWTLVAHMSMMTGLNADEHGVTQPTLALSPDVATVAERLHAAGYRTLGFPAGECVWVEPRYGFGRGFDVYDGHTGPEDARRRIDAELDRLADGRPAFVFLHLFDVHTALLEPGFRGFYAPPAPFDTMFLADSLDRLADVECREVWEGTGTLPPDQLEAVIARYDGGVRYVDSELERIVEGWRERGLLDHALLIVTADHGEALGSHGRVGGHGGLYEEGVRIPLLVRFPDGYRAGEREDALVSVMDYAPTILAETIGLPADVPGPTLREPLAERVVRVKTALVAERFKFVVRAKNRTLIDLVEDPGELRPTSTRDTPQAFETAEDLRHAYRRIRTERRGLGAPPVQLDELDESERANLGALGYADVVGGDG